MFLNGTWQLACSILDKELKLDIPGNFEHALYEGSIISDPYIDTNSRELRKFEFAEFTLSKEFSIEAPAGKSYRLILDGIDGVADVFINGKLIGNCRNSFYAHKFILKDELSEHNCIKIVFHSCIEEMKKYPMRADMFSSYTYNAEAARFRRPAHIWGWDIFPRMVLGGIFYGVKLEEIPEAEIEEFDLVTRCVSENSADLRLVYKVNMPSIADGNACISIEGKCGDHTFSASQKLRSYCGFIHFTVPGAKLWWPRRYGTSHLYDIKITLTHNGNVLDEKSFAYGIRTCSLIAKPVATELAEPDFQFIVNNKKIRVFGTNHIPLDALHARADRRMEQLFALANECSIDMFRVWGGGVYEQDEFYDLCDKYGIMVWQDFMMGCAIYPQDDEFLKEFSTEAAHAVRRLRRHPSIVLWAGDNECDCAPSWGLLDVAPESNKLTRVVLPDVCRKYDISRPYLPSSPWCSPEALAASQPGTDPTLLASEQHLWGPRDYAKSDFYRNTKASFLSEFGYHGAPAAKSVAKFIPEKYRWPLENDFCYHHASNPFLPDDDSYNFRITIMFDQVREFFGNSVPDNLEDFTTASQTVQAEALQFIIELFRMRKKCSGFIWWNLIDGWPQFSDAAVDYYGTKKLVFHVLKNLHKKVLITLSESNAWHRKVMAANDSSQTAKGSCTIKAFSTGNIVWQGDFELAPDTVTELASLKIGSTEKELYLIDYTTDIEGNVHHHYLAGNPTFDYTIFKEHYLKAIYGESYR